MSRSYYSKKLDEFLNDDPNQILGKLTNNHQFALEEQQRNAWIIQIDILNIVFLSLFLLPNLLSIIIPFIII